MVLEVREVLKVLVQRCLVRKVRVLKVLRVRVGANVHRWHR